MKACIKIIFVLIVITSPAHLLAQQSTIANNYNSKQKIKRLQIERHMIYIPQKTWLYNHHPAIVAFKNKLIAMWSDGLVDEDSPAQRVLFSVSDNFNEWSAPAVLANPSKASDGIANVLTAAGFYQFNGTLVAYYGEYQQNRTNTHLWAKTSTDGVHWSGPIDMKVPVNPNHGPQRLQNGRLLICGNFTFPYTDDPTGLSGWHMSSFYPDSLYKEDNPATFYSPAEKSGLPPLCEGAFFQTDDHIIHMLLRVTGKGWKGKLWLAESSDNGITWSKPKESGFTDNDSKFHFGRLPDKRFYYVGIPDTTHHYARTPLILALSADGKRFDKQYLIADEPYELKKNGLWKNGQYGYPVTTTHDGYMYVIVSRQKEAIEVIRFKLNQL